MAVAGGWSTRSSSGILAPELTSQRSYIHIYIYIYIHTYTYTYTHMYIYIYTYIICVYTYIYIYTHTYTCVYIHTQRGIRKGGYPGKRAAVFKHVSEQVSERAAPRRAAPRRTRLIKRCVGRITLFVSPLGGR